MADARPCPYDVEHPHLIAKCRQLCRGSERAARMLAALVVMTAPSEGFGKVILEGVGEAALSSDVREMRLHMLMGKGMLQ
jgi:hypothetical protein